MAKQVDENMQACSMITSENSPSQNSPRAAAGKLRLRKDERWVREKNLV